MEMMGKKGCFTTFFRRVKIKRAEWFKKIAKYRRKELINGANTKEGFILKLFEAAGNKIPFSRYEDWDSDVNRAKYLFLEKEPLKKEILFELKISFDVEGIQKFFLCHLDENKVHEDGVCELQGKYDFNLYCMALAEATKIIILQDPYNIPCPDFNFHEICITVLRDRDFRVLNEIQEKLKSSVGEFGMYFEEICQLGIVDPSLPGNHVSAYCLKSHNDGIFHTGQLKKYLSSNLPSFALSMKKAEEEERELPFSSIYVAQKHLDDIAQSNEDFEAECFGEMMEHLMLENVLGAPKLFNRVQFGLGSKGRISSSVHLFTFHEDDGNDAFQLILGVSGVKNNLCEAVDKVFYMMKQLESNHSDVFDFVDSKMNTENYTEEQMTMLSNYILNNNNISSGVGTAMSAFICYTPYSKLMEQDYQETIKREIEQATSHFDEVVRKSQMSCRFFHIYFLPLNDAESESIDIFNEICRGGRK